MSYHFWRESSTNIWAEAVHKLFWLIPITVRNNVSELPRYLGMSERGTIDRQYMPVILKGEHDVVSPVA